jgi:hypothetical protein
MTNSEKRNNEITISNTNWSYRLINLLKSAVMLFVRSGKKHIDHIFWNKKCPYCNSDVKRLPSVIKITTCANCNNKIYVKRHEDLIKLITEKEEKDIKLHRSLEFTEISFDEYIEIKNRFLLKNGDDYQRSTLLLFIYNELIENNLKKDNFKLLPLLYENKARLVRDNPTEYIETKRRYYIALIKREKQMFGEDKVAVIQFNGKECSDCMDVSKRKYFLMDDVVNIIQTLPTDCLNDKCGFKILFRPSSEFIFKVKLSEEFSGNEYRLFNVERWSVKAGSLIKKGQEVCDISLYEKEDQFYPSKSIRMLAPENGVIEIIQESSFSFYNKCNLNSQQVIYIIHRNPQQEDIIRSLAKRFNYFYIDFCNKNNGDFVKSYDEICDIKCYNDESNSSIDFLVLALEEGFLELNFSSTLYLEKLKLIDYPIFYRTYKNPDYDEIYFLKKKDSSIFL